VTHLFEYDSSAQALAFGLEMPGGKTAVVGVAVAALRQVGYWDPKRCTPEAFQKALPRFDKPMLSLAPAGALRSLPPLAMRR